MTEELVVQSEGPNAIEVGDLDYFTVSNNSTWGNGYQYVSPSAAWASSSPYRTINVDTYIEQIKELLSPFGIELTELQTQLLTTNLLNVHNFVDYCNGLVLALRLRDVPKDVDEAYRQGIEQGRLLGEDESKVKAVEEQKHKIDEAVYKNGYDHGYSKGQEDALKNLELD